MKKIPAILLLVALVGCSTAQPQAPTFNYVFTDNSQVVIGDNNAQESKPSTDIAQTTTPELSAEQTKKTSYAWILWFILGVVSVGVGVICWKKKWIKL